MVEYGILSHHFLHQKLSEYIVWFLENEKHNGYIKTIYFVTELEPIKGWKT